MPPLTSAARKSIELFLNFSRRHSMVVSYAGISSLGPSNTLTVKKVRPGGYGDPELWTVEQFRLLLSHLQ